MPRVPWLVSWRLACVAVAVACLSFAALRAQVDLPVVSYVCPMAEHEDILEHTGKCAICKMDLVPVRVTQVFSCPLHAAVTSDKPGLCPLDKRTLMPVTVNMYWACRDAPGVRWTEPGRCASGRAREIVRDLRSHGDHNPRHDGQLFMAGDRWHHLEATYPGGGLVRVYLYDNFTKPIPVGVIVGRVVSGEVWDPVKQVARETGSVALRPAAGGQVLEARLPSAPLPARFTVKLKFAPTMDEERFDFVFEAYSKDAGPPVATVARRWPRLPSFAAARLVRARWPTPGNTQVGVGGAAMKPPTADQTVAESLARRAALPSTPPELLALLEERTRELGDLVQRGRLAEVWAPALQAKDAALALDGLGADLPPPRERDARAAIRRLVIAAWQMDAAGDLGDSRKVGASYEALAMAFARIRAAYGPQTR